jgi:hypothetical protein
LPRWIFALVQFLPLSLFATYAYWNGVPDEARWQAAFQLASVAAAAQLAVVMRQSRPINRLVLAANIYLLLGGLAFFLQQWWYLRLYDSLRESAIFVAMLGVGIGATLFTRAGFAAIADAPRHVAVRASLWLLCATLFALGLSVYFRGDRTWAAVAPIIGLAVLQRVLSHRAARHPRSPGNASPETSV